jgi:DNA primase
VATPIAWEELEASEPRHWTVRNILERGSDPWASIAEAAASPRNAAKAVEKL